MESSPAARAISIAGLVVFLGLLVYAGIEATDRWPAVLLASLGAVLGAGVAINAIVVRDVDPWRLPPGPPARSIAWAHQATTIAVAAAVAAAGFTGNIAWLAAAASAGALWLLSLRRLVAIVAATDPRPPEVRPVEVPPPSVYVHAFQIAMLTLALGLIYGGMATDTPWLWRPNAWDDFQGPLWLVLLELTSLPLTLAAERG